MARAEKKDDMSETDANAISSYLGTLREFLEAGESHEKYAHFRAMALRNKKAIVKFTYSNNPDHAEMAQAIVQLLKKR